MRFLKSVLIAAAALVACVSAQIPLQAATAPQPLQQQFQPIQPMMNNILQTPQFQQQLQAQLMQQIQPQLLQQMQMLQQPAQVQGIQPIQAMQMQYPMNQLNQLGQLGQFAQFNPATANIAASAFNTQPSLASSTPMSIMQANPYMNMNVGANAFNQAVDPSIQQLLQQQMMFQQPAGPLAGPTAGPAAPSPFGNIGALGVGATATPFPQQGLGLASAAFPQQQGLIPNTNTLPISGISGSTFNPNVGIMGQQALLPQAQAQPQPNMPNIVPVANSIPVQAVNVPSLQTQAAKRQ